MAGTRSGQQYLKKYNEAAPRTFKLTKEPAKQSMKQPVDKQKESWYAKALQKDKTEGSSTPFRFDVLAQLVNIPTRITLYELLRLSKSTREALREALADSESFIAHIPAGRKKEDEGHCLQISKHFPCITFTPEYMQI